MSDPNDILRVLAAKAGGSQALSALEQALSSAEGRCAEPCRHARGRPPRRLAAPQHGRRTPWITMHFPAC